MEKILFSARCGQKQSAIWVLVTITWGFTGGSVIKNPPANAGDTGSIPGSGRSPGEGERQPTPVFLPGKFHGQRSLEGYSPWGHKESDMT